MHELLRKKSVYAFIAAIVIVCAFSAIGYAQESTTDTAAQPNDTTSGVMEAPIEADPPIMASSALADSFVSAPSDSAEVAAGIAEVIRKERAGFINRVKRSGIAQNYMAGGFFMHFLLLCSIIGLVFIIERGWTLSRARVDIKSLMLDVVRSLRSEGPEAAMEVCRRHRGPISAVLHAGLLRASRGTEAVEKAIETSGTIEMSFLERGLVALATIANVAPLLGFLGTVSGMISAFAAIAAAEQVSAKLVAKGIQEALITTATGLIIAVPVTIAHSYFVAQIDRFIIEMEEASAELVDEMLDIEHARRTAGA